MPEESGQRYLSDVLAFANVPFGVLSWACAADVQNLLPASFSPSLQSLPAGEEDGVTSSGIDYESRRGLRAGSNKSHLLACVHWSHSTHRSCFCKGEHLL